MGGPGDRRGGRPTARRGAEPTPTPGLPVFAHLPMLVNEQRKKLSKRRDPVAVEAYRDQGYLPEAFVNYLGLLGWSPPGGEEIFDTDQMVAWFRLEDVNHSPAFFDVDKLTHINGEYIRAMTTRGLHRGLPAVADRRPGAVAPGQLRRRGRSRRMAPLVQERVATLGEVPAMVDFLFLDEPEIDKDGLGQGRRPATTWRSTILAAAIEAYEGLDRPVDIATRSMPPPWPWRRGWGANWARPRPRSGWP